MSDPTDTVLEAIEFVDELPPKKFRLPRPEIDYQRIATKLRARPRTWARIPADSGIIHRASLAQINRGMGPSAFRGGEFQYEYRNGDMYIRYIGPARREDVPA